MKILIAEDDPVSCRILTSHLKAWGHEIVVTKNGDDALEALRQDDAPLLAILDWMMPGLTGVEICRRLRSERGDRPIYIILLTALNCKENLLEGLEAGADDYLTKPFDRHELRVRVQAGARIVSLQENLQQRVRELEEAIVERQHAEEALRSLSLTDHMTGLYNHRGFYNLAEHHARVTRRSQTKSLLIYADMDGLKKINDTMGHQAGSQAITAVAEVLRGSFRDCDIVARLGGDEFAILAPNVPMKDSRKIIERLRKNLKAYNEAGHHRFQLSLSIGAVEIDHTYEFGIEDQMAKADAEMYRDKRDRRAQTTEELRA
jgi:diguanylate cyclase (GGDEF)-like protein